MLRSVPMALDRDVEDASPMSASKEFEADICFMLLSRLLPLSAPFPISWNQLSSEIKCGLLLPVSLERIFTN